jgi:hypothetical protein
MNENKQNQKPLNAEWQKTVREVIDHAMTLANGEIVIKVQNGMPILTEYTVKRKPSDTDEFTVKPLGD